MTRLTRSRLIIGRLPIALAFTLTILGTQFASADDSSQQMSCDCSCDRYALLHADPLPQSPMPENEILECAGACAIAWVRCEDEQALAEAENSETGNTLNISVTAQATAGTELR